MGQLVKLVTPLHQATKRNYLERMTNDKVACMLKAKEYGFDYWDGDRKYGYGGYEYDGRWKPIAEKLIGGYDLKFDAGILDVGCGKAHLLYELRQLLPFTELWGIDISDYAIKSAPITILDRLFVHRTQDHVAWGDDYFDLVISLGCLHNLKIYDVEKALHEIERVGKNKYISVESYRNEQELFNLQCWALTCETFLDPDSWIWLFNKCGYTGDYEFIFFE